MLKKFDEFVNEGLISDFEEKNNRGIILVYVKEI